MRHIFIVNPFSGKGKNLDATLRDIETACEQAGITPEICAAPEKSETVRFMRTAAESGEPVRVYACGGDGTVFNAVNATFGYKNVQIAVVPHGSGNDFVKLFGQQDQLCDISRHINGTPHWIDAIKVGDDISVNICSMGFDAEVNALQSKTKKIPLVGGSAGYNLALLICVFKSFYNKFTIQVDDNPPDKGEFLFAIGGNSRWYGGGFKACPKALPDDGLMDCITVKRAMPRLKMLPFINVFKNGEHLDPKWHFVSFQRGRVMRVHSDTPAAVNIDGEIRTANDVTFELVEKAVCYVVPEGSSFFADRESGAL